MNFYVVNSKIPKALAVLNCSNVDLAEERAKKRFGQKVIVIDEELYQLERQVAPERVQLLLKRLLRKRCR